MRPTPVFRALAGAALLLAGCASPDAGHRPAAPLDAAGAGLVASAIAWPADDWWRAYRDPQLDRLVAAALANGPGLAAAQARIAQARALAGLAEAGAGPQVGATVDSTRQRFSERGTTPPPFAGSLQTINSALVTGRYEFDFWGRNQAAVQAATDRAWVAEAQAATARLVLVAAVARTWFALAGLQETLGVAQRTLAQREETLALVRQRVRAGLDTQVTLKQAEAAVPSSRLRIAAVHERVALARNALAALTGVARLAPLLADAAPALPASVDAAALPALDRIPVGLLGRRPEIVAALRRIDAARGQADVARADFYPNIGIGAFAGLSAVGLDHWLDAGSRTFGIGPALRLPVFDAGRLRASLRVANAELDAAVAEYNQTLLDTVRDVADQVASLHFLAQQWREHAAALEAAEQAYDFARQRYRAGLSTFLVVLSAETAVLEQRQTGAELRARRLELDVALNRALGGGYDAGAGPLAATPPGTGNRP